MIVYKKDIEQALKAVGKEWDEKFWQALVEILTKANRCNIKGGLKTQ